jgi:hypothetical protein
MVKNLGVADLRSSGMIRRRRQNWPDFGIESGVPDDCVDMRDAAATAAKPRRLWHRP